MEKTLYIVRGLPGSGKTEFAKSLGVIHFESDMYFMKDGKYEFDITKIKDAHKWCRESVEMELAKNEPKVVVSNTFTMEWEMEAYFKMAKEFGYKVFSVICENRHGGVNSHNVPKEALDRMKQRFEVVL